MLIVIVKIVQMLYLQRRKLKTMKKLLILLSATILICSCNKEPDIAYALISGEITNPVGDKLTVNRGDFKSEITINPDGSFRDTLDITSGYYYVSQGRERTRIYLEPGYDLTLELDAKQFDETIKYSGVGSENNNYLASKQLNN
jgi:hypothetical protein